MDELDDQAKARPSDGGALGNGVCVVALIRFIYAYDFEARIDDVAGYFHVEVEDVAAALDFYSRNFERIYPLVVAGAE